LKREKYSSLRREWVSSVQKRASVKKYHNGLYGKIKLKIIRKGTHKALTGILVLWFFLSLSSLLLGVFDGDGVKPAAVR
jgi:hypothetical protein